MGIAKGYTLDLYCDANKWSDEPHSFDEFPHVLFGETWAETSGAAKKRGWLISKPDGIAVCPKCAGLGLTIAYARKKLAKGEING